VIDLLKGFETISFPGRSSNGQDFAAAAPEITQRVKNGYGPKTDVSSWWNGNLGLETQIGELDGLLPIAELNANNKITRHITRGLDVSGSMQGASAESSPPPPRLTPSQNESVALGIFREISEEFETFQD